MLLWLLVKRIDKDGKWKWGLCDVKRAVIWRSLWFLRCIFFVKMNALLLCPPSPLVKVLMCPFAFPPYPPVFFSHKAPLDLHSCQGNWSICRPPHYSTPPPSVVVRAQRLSPSHTVYQPSQTQTDMGSVLILSGVLYMYKAVAGSSVGQQSWYQACRKCKSFLYKGCYSHQTQTVSMFLWAADWIALMQLQYGWLSNAKTVSKLSGFWVPVYITRSCAVT